MITKTRAAALAAAALFAIAAVPNWNTTITRTDGGHRLGNEAAEEQLIEFVSYTCSHCATFERQAEGALKLLFVHPGTGSVEVRPVIRNQIDLTATMLAQCGPTERFFMNHTALMLSQDDWFATGRKLSDGQTARWASGDGAARQAMARDLGWYDMFEARGYSEVELNRCLADDARATAIEAQSAQDMVDYGVQGTPSFALNGELLDGVHNWQALGAVLQGKPIPPVATEAAEGSHAGHAH